ncbi:hypothetical protein H5410_045709, partial [Solanum commersonii]
QVINKAHKTILKTLPIVICWNLWKNRCSVKYGGKISSISRVKYLIIKDMFLLLKFVFPYIQWPEVVDRIEHGKHEIRGGGILRDLNGTIVYTFTIPLGEGTNNQAKVQAASYGLNWCIQHRYQNIILERLSSFVQDLQGLAKQSTYLQYVHTYKEANNTADLLSKQSHTQDIIQHYYTTNQLQMQLEEVIFWRKWEFILNMDKAHSNPNAKIWLFWAGELDCNVLDTDEQHTTCELKHSDYPEKFIISYCSLNMEANQSIGRVKYLIFKDMMQLLITVFPYLQWPSNWKDVISMIENCRHELKVIPVGWDKPTMGVYKLNTDGSALTNPGKIGGGGILRDGQGNLVYAYAIPLGFGTKEQKCTWSQLRWIPSYLANGSTTTAQHLGSFSSTYRNLKISVSSVSISNASIHLGKLIVQLIIYLNGVIDKILFNISTRISNYQAHLEEVTFWRKWVCKISEEKDSEELNNLLEVMSNLFNKAIINSIAGAPSDERFRPPDPSTTMPNPNIHLPLL